jgi:DNA-directed RNA polymerase subunit RPC12/RpoP
MSEQMQPLRATEHNQFLVCPYCGHRHPNDDFEDGAAFSWCCERCRQRFEAAVIIERTYIGRPVPEGPLRKW